MLAPRLTATADRLVVLIGDGFADSAEGVFMFVSKDYEQKKRNP